MTVKPTIRSYEACGFQEALVIATLKMEAPSMIQHVQMRSLIIEGRGLAKSATYLDLGNVGKWAQTQAVLHWRRL